MKFVERTGQSAEHNAESQLLNDFNNRDCEAFGQVYTMFYNELLYFTIKLFKTTNVEPQDVFQDVFLKLWQTKNTVFKDLYAIKAYLYISINNEFKKHINHSKYVDRYVVEVMENDYDLLEANIIESEVMSNFHYILGMLPEDSARILKMYFESWSIDDIAEQLGRNKQTIYNKKCEAVGILRRKLIKNKLLFSVMINYF